MIRRGFMLLLSLVLTLPVFALAEELDGPVLVSQLPLDALLVGNDATDGGYTERLETADGMANIVLLRRAGAVSADVILAELYPEAVEPTEVIQEPIAAYPAVRYSFTLGANEDTRLGTLVAFTTDTDTFAFSVDVWADAEGYDELIEWWIESLDLFDDASAADLSFTADLPEDVQQMGVGATENGDYTSYYLVNDVVAVTMLRRAEAPDAEELLMAFYPDALIDLAEEAAPVGSYAATRLDFTSGENEDARVGSLIFIQTESATFAFIADVPIDQWEGENRKTVQTMIDSLNLIEQ